MRVVPFFLFILIRTLTQILLPFQPLFIAKQEYTNLNSTPFTIISVITNVAVYPQGSLICIYCNSFISACLWWTSGIASQGIHLGVVSEKPLMRNLILRKRGRGSPSIVSNHESHLTGRMCSIAPLPALNTAILLWDPYLKRGRCIKT